MQGRVEIKSYFTQKSSLGWKTEDGRRKTAKSSSVFRLPSSISNLSRTYPTHSLRKMPMQKKSQRLPSRNMALRSRPSILNPTFS